MYVLSLKNCSKKNLKFKWKTKKRNKILKQKKFAGVRCGILIMKQVLQGKKQE